MGLQNNIHASEKTVYKIGTTAVLLCASAYFIGRLALDYSEDKIPTFKKSYKDDVDPKQSIHDCFSNYENDSLFIRLRSQQARTRKI